MNHVKPPILLHSINQLAWLLKENEEIGSADYEFLRRLANRAQLSEVEVKKLGKILRPFCDRHPRQCNDLHQKVLGDPF